MDSVFIKCRLAPKREAAKIFTNYHLLVADLLRRHKMVRLCFCAHIYIFDHALKTLRVLKPEGSSLTLRDYFPYFLSFLLFLLLTSIESLPLLEFLQYSSRSSLTPDEAGLYALPLSSLLGFIIPNLGGFHEWQTYLGVVPLVLAIIGAIKTRPNLQSRISILLIFFSLWFALGTKAGLFTLIANIPFASLLRIPRGRSSSSASSLRGWRCAERNHSPFPYRVMLAMGEGSGMGVELGI